MQPKVGHISYLNCFPIYCGLVSNMDALDMELITGIPTELNQMMLQGQLDISPMSSVEYFKNRDKFLLCPHISVSSNNHAKHSLLLSKLSIKKLDGEKIALTSASVTSHVLLKIIMDVKYKIKPVYFVSGASLEGMLKDAKAGLLTGDNALEENLKMNGLYRYDLDEEWKSMTGKKMVHKVWCIRKEFAQKHPDIARKAMEILRTSYEYSVNNVQDITDRASTWEKFNGNFKEKYLSGLDFSFDKNARDGLLDFYDIANETGLIKEKGKLEFYE